MKTEEKRRFRAWLKKHWFTRDGALNFLMAILTSAMIAIVVSKYGLLAMSIATALLFFPSYLYFAKELYGAKLLDADMNALKHFSAYRDTKLILAKLSSSALRMNHAVALNVAEEYLTLLPHIAIELETLRTAREATASDFEIAEHSKKIDAISEVLEFLQGHIRVEYSNLERALKEAEGKPGWLLFDLPAASELAGQMETLKQEGEIRRIRANG